MVGNMRHAERNRHYQQKIKARAKLREAELKMGPPEKDFYQLGKRKKDELGRQAINAVNEVIGNRAEDVILYAAKKLQGSETKTERELKLERNIKKFCAIMLSKLPNRSQGAALLVE